ncbi:hypothetical protein R8Z50_14045 [Longispora sp. K20-0274]|uniref:hypothetical protein n=1 Tax=Longispora sp. K20-0274 TaxID=3088255 RepID=UPI00399AD15D
MPIAQLTATALGTLATLSAADRFRVSCLRLDGGGAFVYWMTDGETYRIAHDGMDWAVTGGEWFTPGQTYRLRRAGLPVGALPLAPHGRVTLRPGTEYELRCTAPHRWTLYVLD